MKKILFYIAGAFCLLWGISHLIPTANVVNDFGDIGTDNRMIILMEWINEGATLIFLGILTILVTVTDHQSKLAWRVYFLIVLMLIAMSVISLFTGFKVDFLPYKLCPVIFTSSAILILIGMLIKPKKTE